MSNYGFIFRKNELKNLCIQCIRNAIHISGFRKFYIILILLSPKVENHAVSQAQAPRFGYQPESSHIPDPANSCPAERTILPLLDEQGNQFSFQDFLFDTNALQLQNCCATDATSPSYPQNAVTTMQSQKMDSRQGHAMEVQTPQACYNQARTTKPSFRKWDGNYVVGTIWGNVRKCFGCKHEFLPASSPDNQFVLVRPESDRYFDKKTKSWRLGRKSTRYYHMSLQCVQRSNPQFSATQLIVPANTPAAVKAVLLERFGMYL